MINVSSQVALRVITFKRVDGTKYPEVIFVPGWISMIGGWKEVLLEMTKDFNVYYVETREKISSQVSGNVNYSVEAIGNDLVELVEILKMEKKKYIFFGSSLGATAILDCCSLIKPEPHSLVLIAPNAEFRIPKYGQMLISLFYPSMYNFVKPYVKWYLKKFRLDVKSDKAQFEKYSEVLDYADPRKLKKAAKAVARYKAWDKLEKIKLPVLIVGALKDKLHEPENTKKIVDILPNSTFIDMETNKNTHSRGVVEETRKFLLSVKQPIG
jgi:pimeloyl-ACP methyl ester carboxylesterase